MIVDENTMPDDAMAQLHTDTQKRLRDIAQQEEDIKKLRHHLLDAAKRFRKDPTQGDE